MNKTLGIIVIMFIVAVFAGCTAQKNPAGNLTNKQESANVTFHPSTGPVGFKILQMLAENNVDALTNKSVSDHLEITLQNVIGNDLGNMTMQYTVMDKGTGKSESYTSQLKGFILKAHSTETIHFDNGKSPNHFGVNLYGIYYTSQNALEITVTVSADGYQAQTSKISKDAGGAEIVD